MDRGVEPEQTADAQRWAAFLDTASFDLTPVDGTASFDSSWAMLRGSMCRSGPEQMATDAAFAAAKEPLWSPWRGLALLMDAEANLLLGNSERAASLLRNMCSAADPSNDADNIVISKSELAVLAMDDGRWSEAGQDLEHALDLVEELRLDDYSASVLALAAAARLALHRGEQHEVHRQLARAMRARTFATFVIPWLAVRGRLQIARVYAAMGDLATTHHLLREIDEILLRRPALGTLVDQVAELRDPRQQRRRKGLRTDATQPRGVAASPVSADASHVPGDRQPAVRLPQHRQLRSRLHLPKAARVFLTAVMPSNAL